MSTVVAVTASLVAIQAARQHTQACLEVEAAFDTTKNYTVQDQRSYAECVMHLHPAPSIGTDLLIAKIVVALTLLCTIIGTVLGYRSQKHDKLMNSVMGGLLGVIVIPSIALIVFLLYKAVQFLGS